ncbi:hypothetical protein [Bhargavaea cecembensis]|uniref:hypothetical protein n=1 Tax=Bhargavaea cecembensis TaxID=394098 RepID=UPI00058DF5D1|nr:hypothetical protein [Bhargavaea cecembensis]
MKKGYLLVLLLVLSLAACSPGHPEKAEYDGKPLKIAFAGEKPEYTNERVTFEEIPLDGIADKADDLSADYDALFVMPDVLEELSTDEYTSFFRSLSIPSAFVDADKGHLPFITEGVSYQTGFDLDNGSHSTVYLNTDGPENREDAWYFYLEDENGHDKSLEEVYTEILQRVEEL